MCVGLFMYALFLLFLGILYDDSIGHIITTITIIVVKGVWER